MKTLTITLLFFASAFTNCQDKLQSSDITKIEFGTSFGMCAGYCTQTLVLTEGLAEKTITPRVSQNLKEKICSDSYDGFSAIAASIEMDVFLALDETIGCPDCADGGAEWIEITSGEKSKKVTYEYGKEPEAVKSIISELRGLYDQLGECD